MPCKTCNHTVHSVAVGMWWCPRCGTLQDEGAPPGDTYVPQLVRHCRELERDYILCDEYPPLTTDWARLGLAESINTPDRRPT